MQAYNSHYISVVDPLKNICTKYFSYICQLRYFTYFFFYKFEADIYFHRCKQEVKRPGHVTIHTSYMTLIQFRGDNLYFYFKTCISCPKPKQHFQSFQKLKKMAGNNCCRWDRGNGNQGNSKLETIYRDLGPLLQKYSQICTKLSLKITTTPVLLKWVSLSICNICNLK